MRDATASEIGDETVTPEVQALIDRTHAVAKLLDLSPSRVSTLCLGGGGVLAKLQAGGDMRTKNIRKALAALDELAKQRSREPRETESEHGEERQRTQ